MRHVVGFVKFIDDILDEELVKSSPPSCVSAVTAFHFNPRRLRPLPPRHRMCLRQIIDRILSSPEWPCVVGK